MLRTVTSCKTGYGLGSSMCALDGILAPPNNSGYRLTNCIFFFATLITHSLQYLVNALSVVPHFVPAFQRMFKQLFIVHPLDILFGYYFSDATLLQYIGLFTNDLFANSVSSFTFFGTTMLKLHLCILFLCMCGFQFLL